MVREILLLGNQALYRPAEEVRPDELAGLRAVAEDMHDTLMEFRARTGRGQGIAAPQIGVPKRMLYLYFSAPVIVLNPVLTFPGSELIEVMDDCMSFPGLHIKVRRYRQCLMQYRNLDWQRREVMLQEDLAELVQHEADHLNGILATQRAIDDKAFYYEPEHAPGREVTDG